MCRAGRLERPMTLANCSTVTVFLEEVMSDASPIKLQRQRSALLDGVTGAWTS